MGSVFRFKQFAVEQSGAKMKIGTDGVLLGAWADCSGATRILDIGTGTGVIALMMAQRSEADYIVGIDIDPSATLCAESNFGASPWTSRLKALNSSAQEFEEQNFDLILSNPPYFTDSLLCPDVRRSMARHTTELTFDQLDRAVCRALSIPDGRFALILPTEQMDKYLSLTSLKLRRRCDVSTKPNTPPKRTMAELALQAGEVEYSTLTIDTQVHGIYTDQYRELTKDFYLKF